MIPELIVTERVGRNNESFHFEWYNNTFDMELFFNHSGRLYSLKDFEDDFNVTINFVTERNQSIIRFGWIIEDVKNIMVDSAWFKIEDCSFDYNEIELETIEILEEPFNITRFHLPDNLVLSFEDLYHKGFVIGWQNKTATSVKGFSGKSSWNLDPITFSGGVITVIGGTEDSPLDFEDLWLADKNGNSTIVERYNITTDDAVWIPINESLRPADYRELGGWNYDLNVTVIVNRTITYLEVFYVIVQGFSREGNYLEAFVGFSLLSPFVAKTNPVGENFAIINGTKIIDLPSSTQLNYTLYQGQWGVVWKQSDTQYVFDSKLIFGNGTVQGETWFADTAKQISFTDVALPTSDLRAMEIRRYAYVRFGTLIDESTRATKDGCDFLVDIEPYRPFNLFYTAGDYNTHDRELYLYACSFKTIGSTSNRFLGYFRGGNHRFWHIALSRFALAINPYGVGSPTFDLYDLFLTSGTGLMVYGSTGLSMDRLFVTDMGDTFWTQGNVIATVENVVSRRAIRSVFYGSTNSDGSIYFVNWDVDDWNPQFVATADGELYRQYEFDLTVLHPNCTAYQNANVTISYYGQGGGTVGSWLTNSTGQIPTQTLTMGFYNQTGGSTIYSYNPYNLLITNVSGYADYNMNCTLSEKTDLEITYSGKSAGWSLSLWFIIAIGCAILIPIVFWGKRK